MRYIHSLGRCGGTLICKCLGAMQGVALLSEIHPEQADIFFDPLLQARIWHGLIGVDEFDELARRLSFYGKVAEIRERAISRGLVLVVRDWTYRSFCCHFGRNSYRFDVVEKLLPLSPVCRRLSIVRHPMQQWLSLRASGMLPPDRQDHLAAYFLGMRLFAQAAIDTNYLRYEDFVSDPQNGLVLVCEHLDIKYDAEWFHNWKDNFRVTGAKVDIGPITQGPLHTAEIDVQKRIFDNWDYQDTCRILHYNPVEGLSA